MIFSVSPGPATHGRLIYRKSEYSIDFEHYSKEIHDQLVGPTGSISVGTLQLEISVDSGKILFPWGLFPHQEWQHCRLIAPAIMQGELYARDISNLIIGGSVDLPGGDAWETKFDDISGWIYTGTSELPDLSIEFADNVAASLTGNRLTGLWMKPILTPD
jgi:hypothetical protein